MNNCIYSQKKIESQYSWSDANPFISKASAQAATQYVDTTANVYNSSLETQDSTLPMPMLIILLMFVIFTIVMSIIYVYHWTQFSLGDRFVERGTMVYFIGLLLLTIPLLTFLF